MKWRIELDLLDLLCVAGCLASAVLTVAVASSVSKEEGKPALELIEEGDTKT